MSKRSEAKKARRRKRLATRDERRVSGEVLDDLLSLEGVDAVLTDRGWEFDVDNSTDDIATWFYAPSGIETDDDTVETVTRIWVTEDEEWHAILVGGGSDAVDYVFTAESLLENLEAVEAYRHGDPAPAFG